MTKDECAACDSFYRHHIIPSMMTVRFIRSLAVRYIVILVAHVYRYGKELISVIGCKLYYGMQCA
jgi:hypothetical protein